MPTKTTRPDAATIVKAWRAGFPRPKTWWRHSTFEQLRATRRNLLRTWRWITDPKLTWMLWLELPRLSENHRKAWNAEAFRHADTDPVLQTLDKHQRRAAACFEDRTLVTAGAGSGKTRTMVARAMYATRRLGDEPRTIAFVTFTTRATREIRERTAETLPGLEVGTIHQLARRVIKIVEGRTVQLSPLAEDETTKRQMIREWLEEEVRRDASLIADKQLRRNALRHDFEDGQPIDAFRAPPDNQKMKSHGEVVIASLLAAAKVPYAYEATFPIPRAHETSLQDYRPDFYIPDDPNAAVTADGGVWLEHYAHDRNGRAPADFKGYDRAREWKRTLHAELKTRYVETTFGDIQRYHFDGEDPGLSRVLVARLREVGKTIDDPGWWTNDDIDNVEEEPSRENARLAIEIDAWISARRQRCEPPATDTEDPFQAALRRLGERVLARYETHLKDTGTTDHDGTILEGMAAARAEPESLPWKHLLIDEYQDINPAQAAFLHAITTPRSDGAASPTFVGVGDDWQAIFSFQGGDPDLIRSGRDPAGRINSRCERINLENGYRFSDALAQASRKLVTASADNPDRTVLGRGPSPERGRPPVAVASCELTAAGQEDIGRTTTKATTGVLTALKHWIPIHETENDTEDADEPLSVLIMGRRRIDVQDPPPESSGRLGLDLGAINKTAEEYGLTVDYRTIHGAKGSEADYAILIDSGPSMAAMRTEQRALDRALEPETGARTDDEHKLWYVAVTRAKRQTIVLVLDADGGASRATRTLIDGADGAIGTDITSLTTWLEPLRNALPCPGCNPTGEGEGRLEGRTTRTGRHMAGCSEWIAGTESCDYTQPACDACGDGLLELGETDDFTCRNPGCRATIPACRCEPRRPMVVRRQKTTAKRFWGCWRFGEPDSCRKTRNID